MRTSVVDLGSNITKINVFAEMVRVISKLSKDPRTKVGALILRPDFSIASLGYNGFPKGFPDTDEYWNDREIKNKIVKHAEENAFHFCMDQSLKDYSMIVTHFPCSRCAGDIVQRGIGTVYYLNEPRADHDCELAIKVLDSGLVSRVFLKF